MNFIRSWFLVLGSSFLVLGSWFFVHRSWFFALRSGQRDRYGEQTRNENEERRRTKNQ
jgi:hypothetical protein